MLLNNLCLQHKDFFLILFNHIMMARKCKNIRATDDCMSCWPVSFALLYELVASISSFHSLLNI